VDQIARRLGFLQSLQQEHSSPGFSQHGLAGRAATLVDLEGLPLRALQSAVKCFSQKGFHLNALHSGFEFTCH
jgi:hypothetical protein